MLEYTNAGPGTHLAMLVLQDLYDEARKDGWIVISMKNDWKRMFSFEPGTAAAREASSKRR